MGSQLRKIARKRAKTALSRIRFPKMARKMSLAQKSDLVIAMIEEKRLMLEAQRQEMLTAEAIQARKEADEAEALEIPAPEAE